VGVPAADARFSGHLGEVVVVPGCAGCPAFAVVDAIGRGEDPPFEADDERAVYTVARQLSSSGRLDRDAYDAAHRFLGDAGMVELVSLCGYYTLVSFVLNAFAVPLPPGAEPM
jgi:4-carboxymuconolactone decarboxylase